MFYECLSAVGACSQKTIAFIKQEGGKPFLRKKHFSICIHPAGCESMFGGRSVLPLSEGAASA